jgi:hypothetical protein
MSIVKSLSFYNDISNPLEFICLSLRLLIVYFYIFFVSHIVKLIKYYANI